MIFNPTLVRLRHPRYRVPREAIFLFNPTLVRLRRVPAKNVAGTP